MPRRKDPKGRSRAPSKAIQAEEIIKCGSDPSYFINRYVKIAHPERGIVKFDTYPFQDDCIKAFLEHRFVIINKSRQLGLSTVSAAYALWMAIFQREKNILIIATKLATAKLFIQKVETMLHNLPEWLVMPKIKSKSVQNIRFSNGSQIKAIPTSVDAGRGEALSLLIIDEAAHVEDIEQLWLGLRPTLSTGGNAILISTPSGVGTLFHKIWVSAKEGDGDFYPIELPWNVHPERDQEWFEKEKKSIVKALGEKGVAQELLCSFMSSGDTFIKADIMERIFKQIKEPIAIWSQTGSGKRDIWIWKYPQTNHRYIISADVARGDGEDFSAFHVIDIDEDEVVADYKGKIQPDKFAEVLVEMGNKYNTALICSEKNNVGIATAYKLKDLKYPNLYYEKLHKNAYMVYTAADTQDYTPGIETTTKNRLEMLVRLQTVLRNGALKVYSKRLYEELQTYIWKGNKPQAQKGYHDDLIMALAIGNSLFDAGGSHENQTEDLAKAMLAGMSVSSNVIDETYNITRNEQSNQHPLPPIVTGNSLDEFMKKQRIKNQNGSKTHNYNNPFWRQFDWVLKD